MKKTVLLIEDTDTLRGIEASILRQSGYEVLESADGKQGHNLVRKARPDLVVADAMLPGKTGFDICTELKGDPAYSGIPILITTSITQGTGQGDAYWRDKAHADGFLSKPFTAQELLSQVAKLLGPA